MKSPLKAFLSALCFGALLADLPAQHITVSDHHHPIFAHARTTYVLEDWDDTNTRVGLLIVEWTAMEDPGSKRGTNPDRYDKLTYRVTLTRTCEKDNPKYSLLTLGLQSPRHRLKILSAPAEAMFLPDPTVAGAKFEAVPANGLELMAVPRLPQPDHNKLDNDKIGFLQFKDRTLSVTLTVHAEDRYVFSATHWAAGGGASGMGHDNEPPENPPR